MKLTLNWLKDHLETDASLDDITYALTDLGLEVEEVVNPLARLAAFTIGHVVSAEKHPDADKLRVCMVETAAGLSQIVCGAPNARPGIDVVIAAPGTYVPGIDTTIKVGSIRGVESHGMMCSMREMELSDEHDGIIELTGSPKVGTAFTDWLTANDPAKADVMIEVKITPNRPDALGIRGIARDLAARGLGKLKPLEIQPIKGNGASKISVTIAPDLKAKGCPLFAGRVISGVKNGPSPDWLQARLKAIGLRPISTLVDITNFFTYDLNRPLHVFDADKVKGGLSIHAALGDEELQALDGKTYTFPAGTMLISDAHGPESIAGIMGGEASGCTEDTVNVFLESAYWDPLTIAASGRALKINSDARYRFERGVDPAFTLPGLELATKMVLDLCGGTASDVVMDGAVPDTARAFRLDAKRCSSLVGMDIPEATQKATLEALGFTMTGDMAEVPSWRPDVLGEVDLVEEVARVASLTKLQGRPLPRLQPGVPRPILTALQRREQIARRSVAALGYNECVSYSFIDGALARMFGGGDDALGLQNPISSEMTHMRPALLPGLLQAAARNQARGFMDLALFEVGPSFQGGEPGEQHLQVCGLLVGARTGRDPHGSRRVVDVFDVKADAEAVLAALGAPARVQIMRGAPAWFHPGRSGMMGLGPKKILCAFGEVHPKVLRELDIKGPAVAFTIWPEEVPEPKTHVIAKPALAISQLQAVERDFAFVVDAKVEALTLVSAAAAVDKALIESVAVFDEFTGAKAEAQMGPGKKSLALSVRIQPQDKTLTDKEIEDLSARIVDKVAKSTGAVLRN